MFFGVSFSVGPFFHLKYFLSICCATNEWPNTIFDLICSAFQIRSFAECESHDVANWQVLFLD